MDISETTNIPPSYREILSKISLEVKNRKSDLAWRTAIIIIPLVVLYLIFKGIDSQGSSPYAESTSVGLFMFFAFSTIALLGGLSVLMSAFVSIEQALWVDSSFKGIHLSREESYKIAKKIFWPFSKFYLLAFWRYLQPSIWFFLSSIVIIIYALFFGLSGELPKEFLPQLLYVFGITFGSIGLFIGSLFYLRIVYIQKMAYTPFVFIDNYREQAFDPNRSLKEISELNEVAKGEVFKRNLAAEFGTGSVALIGRTISSIIYLGSNAGPTRDVSAVAATFINELSSQVARFSRFVTNYILYRFAMKSISRDIEQLNPEIYKR